MGINKQKVYMMIVEIREWIHNNIFGILIILFIGASIGAYLQASVDVQAIAHMLNKTANTNNIITDGINYYSIYPYNSTLYVGD